MCDFVKQHRKLMSAVVMKLIFTTFTFFTHKVYKLLYVIKCSHLKGAL